VSLSDSAPPWIFFFTRHSLGFHALCTITHWVFPSPDVLVFIDFLFLFSYCPRGKSLFYRTCVHQFFLPLYSSPRDVHLRQSPPPLFSISGDDKFFSVPLPSRVSGFFFLITVLLRSTSNSSFSAFKLDYRYLFKTCP